MNILVKNERGSTLVVVMLMILVFTVLGLSILSTSIGGAKRTEIREDQVTDDLDSIRALGEAVAYIKKTIDTEFNLPFGNPDMSVSTYHHNIIEAKLIHNPYGYRIENISDDREYNIKEDEDYTRVLKVSSGKYEQIVYITGMPSFLKYAIGSREILTLNGSTYVEKGNIYAKEKLVISNQAKYIYKGVHGIEPTTFPSVNEENEHQLFIEGNDIEYCPNNCYSAEETITSSFHPLPGEQIERAFYPTAPTVSKEESEYVGVDIEKTFKEKLKTAGFLSNHIDPFPLEINEIIAEGLNSPTVEVVSSFENLNQSPTIKSYLHLGEDEKEVYIDTNRLVIDDKSKWIVIDGSGIIESVGNDVMEISANILITGDLTIRGDIAFDSTIYVLGNTTINNVDIRGFNKSELILMTKGQLEIARINKFLDQVNTIHAYLYTHEDAELYAVGSYLRVEGGIFAHGNLEINAYRGKAKENGHAIEFGKGLENKPAESRLVIKNDKRLFLNQAQGLPKIDRLEVMTDLMRKE